MIAFQVSVNDEPLCIAGVGDLGVLTATLHYVGRQAPLKSPDGQDELPAREIACSIGGLRKGKKQGYDENLEWSNVSLQPGDRVCVAVVDVDQVDQPLHVKVDDPAKREKSRRSYYEQLKKEFGEATS